MKISLAPPATAEKLELWADLLLSHGFDFKILTKEDSKIEGALVLCGGADYGKRPERDEFEMTLIEAAVLSRMPILGVCRGMQLVNLALGGTIEDLEDASIHHPKPDSKDGTCPQDLESLWHPIYSPFDKEQFMVNSRHHQHCDTISPLLLPSWVSPEDGVVEALEGDNILLVQWHPERKELKETSFARNWPFEWLKTAITAKQN